MQWEQADQITVVVVAVQIFWGGACQSVARGSTSMVNGNAFPMPQGTQSINWLLKEQATFFLKIGGLFNSWTSVQLVDLITELHHLDLLTESFNLSNLHQSKQE